MSYIFYLKKYKTVERMLLRLEWKNQCHVRKSINIFYVMIWYFH